MPPSFLSRCRCSLNWGSSRRLSAFCRALPRDAHSTLEVRTPLSHKGPQQQPRSVSLRIQRQLENEQLESTLEHRLWVGTAGSLLLTLACRGLLEVDSFWTGLEAASAVVGAYVTVDLLSGVYHWGIDNYGSASTPMVGKQIEAFQGHHVHPWTISYREFCNNVHTICKPAIPVSLAVFAVHPHFFMDIFMAVGTTLAILAQQIHAWAHARKQDIPPAVMALQNMGLLVSSREHCQHHRQPFNSNYCIIAGLWNKALDESGIFPAGERLIFDVTGVAPRCWGEVDELQEVSYYEDEKTLGQDERALSGK